MYHEKQEKYLGYQEKLEKLSCITGETGEPIMYISRNRRTYHVYQEKQGNYHGETGEPRPLCDSEKREKYKKV